MFDCYNTIDFGSFFWMQNKCPKNYYLYFPGLQEAFDRDYANNTFHKTGWYFNASNDAIFAYKLLVQTGNIENTEDRSQITKVRLVSKEGIIYQPAFYNYLTAWIANDALAYSYSMGEIRPETKSWEHDPFDYDTQSKQACWVAQILKMSFFVIDVKTRELVCHILEWIWRLNWRTNRCLFIFSVPKAKSIQYAQMPFYLSKLSTSEEILDVVIQIRQICDDFTSRGLPNYPSGIPFTFWEQYIHLRFYLMLALLCILLVTFIVLSVVLVNPWLSGIIVSTCTHFFSCNFRDKFIKPVNRYIVLFLCPHHAKRIQHCSCPSIHPSSWNSEGISVL